MFCEGGDERPLWFLGPSLWIHWVRTKTSWFLEVVLCEDPLHEDSDSPPLPQGLRELQGLSDLPETQRGDALWTDPGPVFWSWFPQGVWWSCCSSRKRRQNRAVDVLLRELKDIVDKCPRRCPLPVDVALKGLGVHFTEPFKIKRDNVFVLFFL